MLNNQMVILDQPNYICNLTQQWKIPATISPNIYIYMVGGFNNLEKYESRWEGLFPYIMENSQHL